MFIPCIILLLAFPSGLQRGRLKFFFFRTKCTQSSTLNSQEIFIIINTKVSLYLFCFKLTTIWLCQALCFVCSSNISCQLWSMTLQSSLKNLLHFQICHTLWPKWFVINFCKFCIVLRNHVAKNKTNIFLVECCWHAILVALHVLEIQVRMSRPVCTRVLVMNDMVLLSQRKVQTLHNRC